MASETVPPLDISIEILIICTALKKMHACALIDDIYNALKFHDFTP